jgi:hypothetical protein
LKLKHEFFSLLIFQGMWLQGMDVAEGLLIAVASWL